MVCHLETEKITILMRCLRDQAREFHFLMSQNSRELQKICEDHGIDKDYANSIVHFYSFFSGALFENMLLLGLCPKYFENKITPIYKRHKAAS